MLAGRVKGGEEGIADLVAARIEDAGVAQKLIQDQRIGGSVRLCELTPALVEAQNRGGGGDQRALPRERLLAIAQLVVAVLGEPRKITERLRGDAETEGDRLTPRFGSGESHAFALGQTQESFRLALAIGDDVRRQDRAARRRVEPDGGINHRRAEFVFQCDAQRHRQHRSGRAGLGVAPQFRQREPNVGQGADLISRLGGGRVS